MHIAGAEVVSKYYGESEERLRKIFAEARAAPEGARQATQPMPAPTLGGDEEEPALSLEESKFQEVLDLLEEIGNEEQEQLEEELVVDMAGEHKNGTFETNESTLAYQQEMELAKQESTKYKEENEELEKKLEELDETINKLSKNNELYENTIYKLNQKVQSTLLSNAKLLYTTIWQITPGYIHG